MMGARVTRLRNWLGKGGLWFILTQTGSPCHQTAELAQPGQQELASKKSVCLSLSRAMCQACYSWVFPYQSLLVPKTVKHIGVYFDARYSWRCHFFSPLSHQLQRAGSHPFHTPLSGGCMHLVYQVVGPDSKLWEYCQYLLLSVLNITTWAWQIFFFKVFY